jgi:choice-of-anchor C domain-containing protein
MRTGLIRRSVTAAALVMGLAGSTRADLIVNGSFEFGVNPPSTGYSTLPGGSTDMTGWTVLNAGIDWIHNDFWAAQSGLRSLDLSALAAGGVTQDVATNPGENYTLTFYMSTNPDHRHIGPRFMDVMVTDVGSATDIVSNTYGISEGTRTPTDMQWELQTITFTATGSITRFTFLTDPASSDAGGPALDNVSLEGEAPPMTPVPAPAAGILAGIGVGFVALRRRRLAAAA